MVCLTLVEVPSAWAQHATNGLPAELAPLAGKYQSDLDAAAQTRDKALASSRQPYLNALAAAEQKANSEAKPDEGKAVRDEKEAVTAGNTLTAAPSALLPRALSGPRGYYMREAARVQREYAARAQQLGAEYLRGLAFYENKAQAAGQTDLLKQIQAEKLKVAAQGAEGPRPARGAGPNVVLNGDFAQKKNDGAPGSWIPGGPGKGTGAVATEQGVNFLRMVGTSKLESWFLESLDRPPNAQEVQVSVSSDFKGKGPYGIVVAQRDAANQLVARDLPCVLRAPCPDWKFMSGTVIIRPETKKLYIRCGMEDCSATVDFTDVHAEVR